MDFVDCIVIGAGAVGLAIARRAALAGREVVVIEAEDTIGSHTSSRNNEVMHAGFLYPASSLKARLCRIGRDLMYEYCATRGVPNRRLGKLVIAVTEEEVHQLYALIELGRACGINDLSMLSGEEACIREPNLQCLGAILSPSTGIVDSHAYMLSLQGDAEASGATFAFGTNVERYRQLGNQIIVETKSGADEHRIACAILVNAAGLHSASLASRSMASPVPSLAYMKGSFFSITGRNPFNQLIVPLADTLAMGGAFTIDMGGQGKFGPDLECVPEVNYSVPPGKASQFAAAIRRYYPAFDASVLQPGYSGIRPRVAPIGPSTDWDIRCERSSGAAVVSLFGIDTPGLTASLSIADYVARLLEFQ